MSVFTWSWNYTMFYFCQSDNENTINWFYCIKNSFDTFLLIKYFVWSIRIIRGRVNENFYIWYYFLKRNGRRQKIVIYLLNKLFHEDSLLLLRETYHIKEKKYKRNWRKNRWSPPAEEVHLSYRVDGRFACRHLIA